MRIVIAAQEYPPACGGIGTQAAAKAEGLAALGHDVHVVTHSVDRTRSEVDRDGVHIIRIPGHDPAFPPQTEAARWIGYSTALAAELACLRERTPLDVIDLPEYGGEGYVHLANQAPWARVPTVVQLHGPLVMLARMTGWPERGSPLHEVGTAMERACVRLADRVYSSSACSTRWCQRHYGGPASIPTIHLGVDVDRFRPVPGADQPPTIVFVGRLAESKGVVDLLEATLPLARTFPGLRLTLVGPGSPALTARLAERAEQAGAPDLLDLRGPLRHAELPAVLGAASLLALPSYYEGGPGLVYLEAMACGLPVVATSAGGAVEVVRHGVTGVVVPPGDRTRLRHALDHLLANQSLAREMGRRGRIYVEQHANRRRCLRRLEAFLEEVAGGSRR